MTARDVQHFDTLPDYAKSFDTFCPLGPIVPAGTPTPRARPTCGVCAAASVVSGVAHNGAQQ
ncbi:hypothetical protein [Streptomyces sp. NPDC052811]|uniref:hypothetical protein n=1 Tax=Streptomyces sp. NPDC052811 TaxID=3155731 RepID=UPI00342EABEA